MDEQRNYKIYKELKKAKASLETGKYSTYTYNSAESRDKYKDLEGKEMKKVINAKSCMGTKLANCKDNNSRSSASYIKS